MFWWMVLAVPALVVAVGLGVVMRAWLGVRRGVVLQRTRREPPDREQLLAFGALMLLRNDEPTRILRLTGNRSLLRKGLIELWGIRDAASARATLQGLITGAACVRFGTGSLPRPQRVAARTSGSDDHARRERARKLWSEAGLPLAADTVCSTAAFGYERIAWLARNCHHLGYLAEPEVWRCLAWVADAARAEFVSWHEYAASYVLGRDATYGDDVVADMGMTSGIQAAGTLLTGFDRALGRPHLWQEYPLDRIRAPSGLSLPLNSRPAEPAPRHVRLLGFGALTVGACGESASDLPLPGREREGDQRWLASVRNIKDTRAAKSHLDWLLETGSRDKCAEAFRLAAQGSALPPRNDIPASALMRLRRTKQQLLQAGMPDAAACRSMLAYDLERAAYAARLAFTVGYLDEATMWNYLDRIALLARRDFATWDGYCISYLLAHALLNGDDEYLARLMGTGVAMLRLGSPFVEYRSPWQKHPLDGMNASHAARSGDAVAVESA